MERKMKLESLVRYNGLDPEKYKTGTYEYCVFEKNSVVD